MIRIQDAEVHFLSEEEGGIQDGFSGMRPSFNIDGSPVLCVVRALSGAELMPRGGRYRVEIELPYGEKVGLSKHLEPNAEFHLQMGGAVIAKGVIKSI